MAFLNPERPSLVEFGSRPNWNWGNLGLKRKVSGKKGFGWKVLIPQT